VYDAVGWLGITYASLGIKNFIQRLKNCDGLWVAVMQYEDPAFVIYIIDLLICIIPFIL
jgi:hypothetical protein